MGRILVTGIGLISAIGGSANENRQSLMNKKCGLSDLDAFDSRFAHIMPFGEIKITTSAFADNYKLLQSGITRPCFLALHALNEALADAGLSAEDVTDKGTALVNASTVGGMCLTDELYHDANSVTGGSPWLNSYDCASISFFPSGNSSGWKEESAPLIRPVLLQPMRLHMVQG